MDIQKLKLNNEVLDAVYDERYLQLKKWGLQRHSYGVWLMILMEEVGEVAQAMQKGKKWSKDSDQDNLYEELIQVAAVAVAIAEQVLEEKAKTQLL
ncbi:hypothetical protein [Bacillus sp. FSL K6-3431]|uniref:hypothetical protein n=1 Tax=Bacillus sp. FSL K6-3431 TaxID=2921500 RepID=UPI0030F86F26